MDTQIFEETKVEEKKEGFEEETKVEEKKESFEEETKVEEKMRALKKVKEKKREEVFELNKKNLPDIQALTSPGRTMDEAGEGKSERTEKGA